MIHYMGRPDLFLTFSAADYHWDSLMKHMPRYEEWKEAPPHQKHRIARDCLRSNPHIGAFHFSRRHPTSQETAEETATRRDVERQHQLVYLINC